MRFATDPADSRSVPKAELTFEPLSLIKECIFSSEKNSKFSDQYNLSLRAPAPLKPFGERLKVMAR